MNYLYKIKPGDTIIRIIGNGVKMPLKVTDVSDNRIICGDYEFSRKTGAEIDEFFGTEDKFAMSYIEELKS